MMETITKMPFQTKEETRSMSNSQPKPLDKPVILAIVYNLEDYRQKKLNKIKEKNASIVKKL